MTIIIRDGGRRNVVSITEEDLVNGNALVELHGDNNEVAFATAHAWGTSHIVLNGDAKISIGPGCVLTNLMLYAGPGAEISIGATTGFSGATGILAHEATRIMIGAGCLFASETNVMGSDMHSIIQRSDGCRINPPRDVLIEDKVWIGFRATVLKGSHIGEGAVIGACAVVSGSITPYSVAVGNPATVVRQNVTWHPTLLPFDC